MIYVKRLSRGSAKLFVNFESTVKKWRKLRKVLTDKFSKTVSSKQVHQKLNTTRKKQDESYQEYMCRILGLASYADIETEAKIQYIIEGTSDEESNKSILYEASLRNIADSRNMKRAASK